MTIEQKQAQNTAAIKHAISTKKPQDKSEARSDYISLSP